MLIEIEGDEFPHAMAFGVSVMIKEEEEILFLILASGVGTNAGHGTVRRLLGAGMTRRNIAQAMDAHA